VSAIHRRRVTAERRRHVEPADVQLDGKAAVTERPPVGSPQKVAERVAKVIYQRISRPGQRVYPSLVIRSKTQPSAFWPPTR